MPKVLPLPRRVVLALARAAAVLVALALPAAALAAPEVRVSAPLLPLARPGAPVPVVVEIAADAPVEGRIEIALGDGGIVRRPFAVGRGTVKRIAVPVVLPGWVPAVRVEVRGSNGRTLAEHTFDVGQAGDPEALHVVAIGESPLGLTLLREIAGVSVPGHPRCVERRGVRVESLLPAALPDAWFHWSAVDVVVWRRPDPAALAPEQLEALRRWVLAGGTLVLSLGDDWRNLATSRLASLVGGTVGAAAPSLDALVAALGIAGQGLPPDGVESLPVVALAPAGAAVRLSGPSGALVLDHRPGAGRVVTLGFDLEAGELRGALDREQFWRRLLGLPAPDDSSTLALAGPAFAAPPCVPAASSWQVEADPAEAWATSLRRSLSAFERANPLPLGLVIAFGLAYLALIGPLDFVLVRRLRRPMLTWVTFPAMALGASVAAAVLVSTRKAGDTEIACVEVVDLFPGEEILRGSGWCSMWSSRRQDVVVDVPRGDGLVRSPPESSVDEALLPPRNTDAAGGRSGLAFRAAQWAVAGWRSAWVDAHEGHVAVGRDAAGRVTVENRTGFDLDTAWVVGPDGSWPLRRLPDGASAALFGRYEFRLEHEVEDPPPGFGVNAWDAVWAALADPYEEHPARLPVGVPGAFVLFGFVADGIAPPLPEGLPAPRARGALLRVPLPDLSDEDLP